MICLWMNLQTALETFSAPQMRGRGSSGVQNVSGEKSGHAVRGAAVSNWLRSFASFAADIEGTTSGEEYDQRT